MTRIDSAFVQGQITKIYRDGAKALMDITVPPSQQSPKGMHHRSLYDLQTQRSYDWDPMDPSVPCTPGAFSGDWGDPFASSAEMTADIPKQNPKQLGAETVNGIATQVLEVVPSGQGKSKLWLDPKYGLIVKWESMGPDGQYQSMIEVKELSFARPPASVFILPPNCAKAAAGPPPVTEEQRIAADTGGSAQDYVDAITTQPSASSCTALFRVVHAGTMEPITSGFQIGIDTTVDPNHRAQYVVGPPEHAHFSGGGLHEVTGEMRNGVLRIDSVPPQFDLEAAFGKGGFSSSLVYRQCFQPQTVLLLVVKNPEKLSEGTDLLWVKSGKFAAAAAAGPANPPSATLNVTGVSLLLSFPGTSMGSSYSGSCPLKLDLLGNVTASGSGQVRVRMMPEGRPGIWPEEVLNFSGPGTQQVHKILPNLGSNVWKPGSHHTGWYILKVLSPQPMESDKAEYDVTCR
jgi:hypothetical protein